MRILHLVKVVFDRRTPAITDAWLAARYSFFKENTGRSLVGQTFKNFGLWVSCGVNMSWGDAALARAETGADFVTCNPDHAPGHALMSQAVGYDYVYVTRIDSDDLYAPDALQLAHDCRPGEPGRVEASVFKRGYMHDVRSGALGVYCNHSSPFHTMMIPGDVFRSKERYAAMDYGDHSKVYGSYPTQTLPDWRFCVLVHGNNFISDMNYANEPGAAVERAWSLRRFAAQPVTFDVDDFCDRWNVLPELDALKDAYPDFRCTLFTIPARTSRGLLMRARERNWVELAVHGLTHEPNEELKSLTPAQLKDGILGIGDLDYRKLYALLFRPPGWFITPGHIEALNELKMSVALHLRDEKALGPLCAHGHYVCDQRPYWHGHTHDVCGNGLRENLPLLLKKWRRGQAFATVGDSILVPQGARNG